MIGIRQLCLQHDSVIPAINDGRIDVMAVIFAYPKRIVLHTDHMIVTRQQGRTLTAAQFQDGAARCQQFMDTTEQATAYHHLCVANSWRPCASRSRSAHSLA